MMMLLSPGAWETRHTFAVMSFLGLANVYAMRVNLSVAIVAMINHSRNNKNQFFHLLIVKGYPVCPAVTPHPAAAYGGVIHSDEVSGCLDSIF